MALELAKPKILKVIAAILMSGIFFAQPAQSTSVCAPGPYILPFEWDKSALTERSKEILEHAIEAETYCGSPTIWVSGHSDSSGNEKYNLALSNRRVKIVEAYLIQKGLKPTKIRTKAFGEKRQRIETVDAIREPRNRRVEVTFGPPSESPYYLDYWEE